MSFNHSAGTHLAHKPFPNSEFYWYRKLALQIGPNKIYGEVLCSSGSVREKSKIEDVAFLNSKGTVFGVADGATGIYDKSRPPLLIDGGTTGRFAALTLAKAASEAGEDANLIQIASAANTALASRYADLPPLEKAYRGGTTGALIKYTAETLETLCWGDAYIMIEMRDGSVICSENQLKLHDGEMYQHINRLMSAGAKEMFPGVPTLSDEQLEAVRKDYMWPRFSGPILAPARNARINNKLDPKGYGLLNGDYSFLQFPVEKSYDLETIKRVLICTDGMLSDSPNGTQNERSIRERLHYAGELGMERYLGNLRSVEGGEGAKRHIQHQEATGIIFTLA